MFAKGTPLRVGPLLKLESVDTAAIADTRFTLPGTVLEPMEFFAAISPDEGGSLPKLP